VSLEQLQLGQFVPPYCIVLISLNQVRAKILGWHLVGGFQKDVYFVVVFVNFVQAIAPKMAA
jgi:hypothetical protein